MPFPFQADAITLIRGGRPILKEFSLSVAAGDAVALRGANGAGKTSLLRTLAALTPVASGTLSWADRPVADDPDLHRSRIAWLGHGNGLTAALTVRETLAYWRGLFAGHAAPKDADLLARVGLDGRLSAPIRILSAGQKRRLALARLVLAHRPLWLLDEPANSLDADGLALLQALIAAHRQQGGAVILALHGAVTLPECRSLTLAAPSSPRRLTAA